MKAEPRSEKSKSPSPISDESLLDSFDPVVEGASFQILEEGIDLAAAPEVLETFDLAEALSRVPDKLFFRIGDAAELLDVKPYVLRFWETEFPMVRPTKSRSGQRVYRKKDVEMLLLIKHLLYVERFSIEGARKRIRELKLKPASAASRLRWKNETVVAPTAASGSAPVSTAGVGSNGVAATGSLRATVDTAKVRELLESAKGLASADLSKFFRF